MNEYDYECEGLRVRVCAGVRESVDEATRAVGRRVPEWCDEMRMV